MVVYEVKTSSRQKNNKLRWLATDINLNCYTLGVLSLMIEVGGGANKERIFFRVKVLIREAAQ